VTEFLYMGGYGFYVWSSYLLVVIMFGYHYFSPVLTYRRQVKELLADLDPEHIQEFSRRQTP
jgi:heme exporter protein CcmD